MGKIAAFLRSYGPIIGLGLITLIVFSRTISFDFLFWDDQLSIVRNPQLQAPVWQWSKIGWMLSLSSFMRFMPLSWLAHMVICSLSNMSPAAYHLSLLILHLINSLLVYHLALRILSRFAVTEVPHEAIAFITSAFWAANGLRVEVLGWCTALPYPLATLFALGSFHFYLNSIDEGHLKFRPYFWSFILNGLSVSAHPIALGYALCLPFFDRLFFREEVSHRWNPRSSGFGTYWASRALFALPSIAIMIATIKFRLHPTGVFAASTAPTHTGIILRLMHGMYAWAYLYLRQFWPFGLTPGHFAWSGPAFHWIYLPALFLIFGLLIVAWWKKSATTMAILAISVSLAGPMLGLFEKPATPVDRYSYLPDAFFSLFLAWLASRCWPRRPTLTASRIVLAGCLASIAILGLQSRRQLRIWENSHTLFAHLEASPEIQAQPMLQEHIYSLEAAQLLVDGQLTAALDIYNNLTRLESGNYLYWHQRGLTLHLLGRETEALQSLHTAYALGQNPVTLQLIESINAATLSAKP